MFGTMEERQIINVARPSPSPTSTSSTIKSHCTPFVLPLNGILTLGDNNVITLTSDATFLPECTGSAAEVILTGTSSPSYTDFRDPFYASTIPQCYALAAATVIAYMLVIMLFITPRTFLHQGVVILGRRGFTNGPSGSNAGIGIGGRPWLQKVAALTVAISLTIATAETFRVAEKQYGFGYMDAQALQASVEDATELKVIRVISDTFLWLAQAQTLIRLFPRQREKIIIKWTAFALISLDVLFSILNNFVYQGANRPATFVDAVPALAYLFQLALSLLYAAWVIYYSITKRQFAFYHIQMKNICLVALLSLVSVLVPIVFFVLDISKPDVAGWGDYVRWVGAAAASVVVWEWVERIETLERHDKKDGVLGREVFDGDEMLETSSDRGAPAFAYRVKRDGNDGGGSEDGRSTGSNGRSWPGMAGLANRYRPRPSRDIETGKPEKAAHRISKKIPRPRPPLWPTRPPPAATPISRADTASAESTVYAIRYHPISEPTPPVVANTRTPVLSRHNSLDLAMAENVQEDSTEESEKPFILETESDEAAPTGPPKSNAWQSLANVNPFKRRARDPPAEVSAQIAKAAASVNGHDASNKWDIKSRFEDFASVQAEKMREKSKSSTTLSAPLPKTVIPAPPRRRNLAATLEDIETAERVDRVITLERNNSNQRIELTGSLIRDPAQDIPQLSIHPSPQPGNQRLSDPYTPNDYSGQSFHQRGALSFVISPQHDDELLSPVSPLSPAGTQAHSSFAALSAQSSTAQLRPLPGSPRRDGVPVMSIPAPPRRRRTNEDDE